MYGRSNYHRSLAVLAMAAALCGCGSSNFDTSGAWFTKPIDLFGSKGGYTYAQLDASKKERPITANDLIDANGACPALAASTSAPTTADAGANPAGAPDVTSRLGGGVGIGTSECDVVSRAGPPTDVNLSSNTNGDRVAILTFRSGPRPGIYRFVAGRLTEMDRVEEQQPPAPPPPKTAKKKPSKTDKPPKPHDAT